MDEDEIKEIADQLDTLGGVEDYVILAIDINKKVTIVSSLVRPEAGKLLSAMAPIVLEKQE